MTETKSPPKEAGFTLLEAVIAMAILSVGILGTYSMQVASIRGNAKASNITMASSWGMKKIEELIDSPYSDIADTDEDGTAGLEDTTGADYSETTSDGLYTIFTNVAEDIPISGCKTIYVLVQDNSERLSNEVVVQYVKEDSI